MLNKLVILIVIFTLFSCKQKEEKIQEKSGIIFKSNHYSVEFIISNKTVQMARPLNLEIKIKGKSDTEIKFPEIEPHLENLMIIDESDPVKVFSQDGFSISTFYVLEPELPIDSKINPIEFNFNNEKLTTNLMDLKYDSLLDSTSDNQLKEVKLSSFNLEKVEPESGFRILIIAIISGVTASLLCLLLIKRARSKRKIEIINSKEKCEALNPQDPRFEESYNSILNDYLQNQFKISVTALSLEEMTTKLQGIKNISKRDKEYIIKFYDSLNALKYQPINNHVEKNENCLSLLSDFIDQTFVEKEN